MRRCLHDLFDEGLARSAAQTAVEIPGTAGTPGRQRLDYAEIDRRAERIRALLGPGPHRDRIVALLFPKDSPHVHAGQLGVLRAGAAFTCLDAGIPDEQVRFVLEDSGAEHVLTDEAGSLRLRGLDVPDARILHVERSAGVPPPRPDVDPESLAYVIYTSGTTGRPKGVMIEHRSIVHLLESEQAHFELGPADRCVQVSSNAYDSAIEEAWLPFSAGATLVLTDDVSVRSGPDFATWLREERISVIMPTPTLLRSLGCEDPAAELPELRLVYAGGEAMTQELAERWSRGKWLENGYGPTECTVTVTRDRVQAGAPITIGRPIGANRAHVLDAALRELPAGEAGELCFAGPCLARGYLNQGQLTATRFVEHPELGRIYRTGDLASIDDAGRIRFSGRMDSQVKIRGHRIELEQIESVLGELPGIREAACAVRGEGARAHIVAFLVLDDGELDGPALRSALASRLPTAMIPERFEVLSTLPRSVGGKLDRRALPLLAEIPGADPTPTGGPAPVRILGAMRSVLGRPELDADTDFFAAGGNSLLAAELISTLRRDPELERLTVRDLYTQRSAAGLAGLTGESAEAGTGAAAEVPRSPSPMRVGLVTTLQMLWLTLLLLTGSAVAWVLAYLALPWLLDIFGLLPLLLLSPVFAAALFVVYTPFAFFLAAWTKRILVGRYEAGRIRVWSLDWLRHWFALRMVRLAPWGALRGTVFFNAGLRLLGARIGKRVHVHRGVDLLGGGWDLLEIGDDVTLSQDAALGLCEYDDGDLLIAPVRIGAGSTLDVRSGVEGNASVGRGAVVRALSSVPAGAKVPGGALADGVPTQTTGAAWQQLPTSDRALAPWLHGLLLLLAKSLVGTILAAPMFGALLALLIGFDIDSEEALAWIFDPLSAPLVCGIAIAFAIVSLVAGIFAAGLLLRWSRPIAPGVYARFGLTYLRIWMRTALVEVAGRWLSGALYWRFWLRMAGMRLGANAEISTIIDVLPERIRVGEETFFADGIYLGGPRIHQGSVEVADTSFGPRTFLGNHVVVPAGAELPEDVLFGVSTRADTETARAGSSWFGHPAFELPRREVVTMDRHLTHEPGPLLYVQRLFWESLRFALPAVMTVLVLSWFALVTPLGIWFAPVVSLGVLLFLAVAVLALKWSLLGRVRPGTHGLWSGWCCRWDFLYVAWGMLSRGVLASFEGTLALPWYLRAMGMRVGRRVVLAGSFAQVVDPDMLDIGDGATVDPLFQAHTFEDRVLKIGRVRVRARATVRRNTVLFYGADIGEGTHVGAHSVVMKKEALLAERRYLGCPTRELRPAPANGSTPHQFSNSPKDVSSGRT